VTIILWTSICCFGTLTAWLVLRFFGGAGAMLKAFLQVIRKASLADASSQLVQNRLQERHHLRVHQGSLAGAITCALYSFRVIPVSEYTRGRVIRISLLALIWLGFILCHVATRRTIRRCFLHVPYHGVMFFLCVMMSPPSQDGFDMVRAMVVSAVGRTTSVYLCQQMTAVLFWNLVHLAMIYWTDRTYMGADILICLLSLCLYVWLRVATTKDLVNQIEVTEVKSERQACRRLLSSVCDAVVELDDELRIAEEAPHLGAWLLHGRKSLMGLKLEQLLYSKGEKRLFHEEATRSQGEENMCAAFHLKLRDSTGSAVPAECFHVKFHSGLGNHHLLGLRESVEKSPPGKLALSASPEAQVTFLGQPAPDAMVVEFDVCSWDVLSASRPFYHRFHMEGPLKAEIVDYLDHDVQLIFKQEITKNCNELLHSDNKVATINGAPLPFLLHSGHAQSFRTNIALYKTMEESGGLEDVRGQLLLLEKMTKECPKNPEEVADSPTLPESKAAERSWAFGASESGSILEIRQGRMDLTRSIGASMSTASIGASMSSSFTPKSLASSTMSAGLGSSATSSFAPTISTNIGAPMSSSFTRPSPMVMENPSSTQTSDIPRPVIEL